MTILRTALGAGCSLLLLSAAVASTPPPVSAFVALPHYRLLSLSPDGRQLATVTTHDFDDHVGIIDLQTMKLSPGVNFDDAEPLAMWWKGTSRLLFIVRDVKGGVFFRTYDLETRKIDQAIHLNRSASGILNPLPDDPEHLIVTSTSSLRPWPVLHRFNLVTGKIVHTESNPGHVYHWFTNRAGEAVAGLGQNDDGWFLVSRPDNGEPWKQLSLGDGPRPHFRPVAVHSDQRRLVAWDISSHDTIGIVLLDPVTGSTEPVFHSPAADVRFMRMRNNHDRTRLRLYATLEDTLRYRYFDPADETLAAQIDASLPGMINNIISHSADESKLLIESGNDHVFDRYLLLDRSAGKLMFLGHANPELARFRSAPATLFSFNSRDGLLVHGRLHRPEGASLPPGVVLLRPDFTDPSSHEFDDIVQLFVSRGYAVLQIDHRGVYSYGRKFAAAGERKLDTAMADDIGDGVRHAIQQGWIDPERVAILGQHQGGILAVYAMARHPGLFRSWLNINTSFQRPVFRAEDMALDESSWKGLFLGVGEKLKLRSYANELDPVSLVPQITIPSFHYYSSVNMVNREGAKVRRLVGRSGVPHEFLTGIPVRKIASKMSEQYRQAFEERVRLYTAMLEFLDRHLRPGGRP